MSTFIFVGILLLILSGCATIEKSFDTKPMESETVAQSSNNTASLQEKKGQKPSEILSALLAEQSPDHLIPVEKKIIAALPAPKTAAHSAPQKVATKTALPVRVAQDYRANKSSVVPMALTSEPQKTADATATQEPADTPATLNDLMQKMPKGKMVFAAPQTPSKIPDVPVQTSPVHAEPKTVQLSLPVANTQPVNPKTADPIDSMAAEIMHAPASPAGVATASLASESNAAILENAPSPKKKKGIFIPITNHTTLKLKPADMEKLVASNTEVIISDASPDNSSLRSRIRSRAFNHGVILADKPVLVPAKQISEF